MQQNLYSIANSRNLEEIPSTHKALSCYHEHNIHDLILQDGQRAVICVSLFSEKQHFISLLTAHHSLLWYAKDSMSQADYTSASQLQCYILNFTCTVGCR